MRDGKSTEVKLIMSNCCKKASMLDHNEVMPLLVIVELVKL